MTRRGMGGADRAIRGHFGVFVNVFEGKIVSTTLL